MTLQSRRTDDVTATVRRLRHVVLARWLAVAFGVAQVGAYETLQYPSGVRAVAYGLVAILAVGNVAAMLLLPRVRTARQASRFAVATLVFDGFVAGAFTWLFSFDPVSALFAILFLIPIEGALHFQLRGAMWSWAGVAVMYTGREWFGVRYGNPFEPDSLMFRVGLLGLVALVVGLLARDLDRQRRLAEQARDEARRADEWRSQLVMMLAHDVRSPLTAVRGSLQLLRDRAGNVSPATTRELSELALRQTDRTLMLARDLLDLARSESGRLELTTDVVGVADVVRRAVDLLPRDGERVLIEVPHDVAVVADEHRLEQILFNLLVNAVRHGRPPVRVSATRHGAMVALRVRDHGPGVDDDVLEGLFEPFSAHGEGGAGLGIWVVRALVEAHGGRVAYADADPGAVFEVTLPAAAGTKVADRPADADQVPG